jgi:hypothetical protein
LGWRDGREHVSRADLISNYWAEYPTPNWLDHLSRFRTAFPQARRCSDSGWKTSPRTGRRDLRRDGRKIFDLHQDEGEAPIQSRAQWRLTGIGTMHSNNRYWLEHDPVALAVLLIGFGVELFVFSI